MNKEHTKSVQSPTGGFSVDPLVQQVHYLSMFRLLQSWRELALSNPRPLSTVVLSRTRGKFSKHHSSASAKPHDVFGAWVFACYLVRSSALQQPHPCERSVRNSNSMSLLAQTACGVSQKKGNCSWCTPWKLYYPNYPRSTLTYTSVLKSAESKGKSRVTTCEKKLGLRP